MFFAFRIPVKASPDLIRVRSSGIFVVDIRTSAALHRFFLFFFVCLVLLSVFVSAALSFCFFFFFFCFSVSGVGPLRFKTVLFLLPSSVCCCFIVVVDGLFLFLFFPVLFFAVVVVLSVVGTSVGALPFLLCIFSLASGRRWSISSSCTRGPCSGRVKICRSGLCSVCFEFSSTSIFFHFVFLFLRCFLYPCCMVFLPTGVHFRRMRFNALGTLVSLVVTRAPIVMVSYRRSTQVVLCFVLADFLVSCMNAIASLRVRNGCFFIVN